METRMSLDNPNVVDDIGKELIKLNAELEEAENTYKEYYNYYKNVNRTLKLYETKKTSISIKIYELKEMVETSNIFGTLINVEGLDTLTNNELGVISKGMDKTDYRMNKNTHPRFIDLERLVKDVIECKTHYPGWILVRLDRAGQYDTYPPQTFYKFTYKTPEGYNVVI
jgi:hypothetical protein